MSSFFKMRVAATIQVLLVVASIGLFEVAQAEKVSIESSNTIASDKLSRSQRKAALKQQKQDMAELESSAVIAEVLRLQWQVAPLYGAVGDTQKIGLEKVFRETAARNLSVRQADAQIKDAEQQAKELVENPLILLNPVQMSLLKQAGASNVQAAKSQAQAARQKALLESATMYSALTQAFLAKYLAFQAIEQGRNQLKLEEQRFVSGESDRFGVTQTQMALIERYNKYLTADDLYYAASLTLGNHIDFPEDRALVPEEVSLQSEINMVPTLKLLPDNLTLEKVQKASLTRPDIQAAQFRKEAMKKLIKASFGQEKHKREADLRLLEMQSEKALDTVSATTSRAFAQHRTAQKSLQLAQQRYELAREFVRQLEVSNKAGFSSTKDVLDGQLELARANSALIEARLSNNLTQVQLAYEMGLLQEDLVSHPLPPNAL
jgi:hypothetical protein